MINIAYIPGDTMIKEHNIYIKSRYHKYFKLAPLQEVGKMIPQAYGAASPALSTSTPVT